MDKWIKILKTNDYIGAKKYIQNGAKLDDSNESGESILAMSLRHKCDNDLVMLLIENGADIFDFDEEGVSIFEMAITYDNQEIVKYLVEKGVDVNKTIRKSKFTPLMAATSYGRIEVVKFLLSKGANKEAVDSKGISAKEFARKMNKKSVLALF